MHWTVYSVYLLVVGLIRVWKWIEYQILLLVTPFLKWKGKQILGSIGVVLDCASDEYSDITKCKQEAEEKLLVNYKGPYESVVRLRINDDKYFTKLSNLGSLGAGETFMDKTWNVFSERWEDVTEVTTRILENNLLDLFYHPLNSVLEWLELHAFNLQTRKRAFEVGKIHYDLGNDLFETMLDPWLQYTCGYWKDASNLNEAQIAKMDLIAKKLDLKPKMRVLDIGCGWGTLCKYLAEKYQVECVGVTIGKEGAAYGQRICAGLPVDIRVQDYRDVKEKFDRIVSVGMFEHVGKWNYKEYFEVASKCLKDDGLFLLHTIGRNHYNFPGRSEPWGNKYIFPNGMVPSPKDIANDTAKIFVIEDWHNLGLDYAKTLFCWRENFVKGWPKLEEKYGGEPFFRMWVCYLSLARAMFKSRRLQLWQIVLSKDGLKRDYRAIR